MRKLMALAFAMLLCATAHGATHVVDPSDSLAYSTIAAALAAVSEGDTVLVTPGTYTGEGNRDMDIPAPNFVLLGEGGSGSVIIDGQDQNNHHCFNLYGRGRAGHNASMVIEGFTIRNFVVSNSPHGPGAAIRLQFNESPTIRDVVIEDCQALATWGAGIWCNNNCSPIVTDVVVRGCYANNGAAIYCSAGSSPVLTNVTVEDCTVYEHGAVYIVLGSDPQFNDCRFQRNESATDGGAVYAWSGCAPAFGFCHFIENTAGTLGGAIRAYDSCDPIFSRCTFVYNTAGSGGDAMDLEDNCYPSIFNSIFALNGHTRGTTIRCDGSSVPTATYCFMSSNAGGDDVCGDGPSGTNFFTGDPLFCNIESLDLTLASNSPCLAGNNAWGQNIGAEVQGCTQSPVEDVSWGTIKAMYR